MIKALGIARSVITDAGWCADAQSVEIWLTHLADKAARREAAAAQLAAQPASGRGRGRGQAAGRARHRVAGEVIGLGPIKGLEPGTCASCHVSWRDPSPGCVVAEYHSATTDGTNG